MVLVGIVLRAACVNLGSLSQRARQTAREIAIRRAIGSGRWRIVRQIVVEACLISMLGGACAYGLAWIAPHRPG